MPPTVTDLYSSYSSNHRPTVAEYKRMGYASNGWNGVRRWSASTSTIEIAGIDGPPANYGSWTPAPVGTANNDAPGIRVFRYRYLDSRTGYVSNPSEESEPTLSLGAVGQSMQFLIGAATAAGSSITNVAITGTDTLTRAAGSWIADGLAVGDYPTFSDCEDAANNGTFGPITSLSATVMVIANAGLTNNADDDTLKVARSQRGRIKPSTDTKVDKIVLEATVAGGTEFFKAAEALNTASTITHSLTDVSLEQQILPWPDDGHDPPPIAQNIVSHRERIWLFGQVTHSIGTAAFTNASATVAQGSSPDWNAEALGSAPGESSVQWLIRATGSNEATYEIDYYNGAQIIMKTAYADGTETVSYKIFSRANVVWVSEPGYPESFSPLRFINGPNAEDSGNLTAGVGYGSSMIFFSPTGMYRYAWDTDPLVDGFWTPLSNKSGALNQRVVIEVEGTVYAMDRKGWHAWRGVFPQKISRPLGAIADSIDFSLADRFHCCYLPDSRAIRWFVCYTGDTYPKHYVQFDLDSGAWSTGEYLQGITDSRLVDHGSGQRMFLLDENGYSWWGDYGLADGCPAANSHVTTTTGSSTTVIQCSTTLPTSGTGLAGMYLSRRTAAGARESRLISSNTSSAITVSSAFSAAPSSGLTLWVGAIPSKLKTRAFGSKTTLKAKNRSGKLAISFKPTTSARYLQVRVYEDLSSTAKTWSTAQNARTGFTWPGANTLYPTSDWVVDLSTAQGLVHIPIGSEWKRWWTVELECDEPDADFNLIALEFDGQMLEETDK